MNGQRLVIFVVRRVSFNFKPPGSLQVIEKPIVLLQRVCELENQLLVSSSVHFIRFTSSFYYFPQKIRSLLSETWFNMEAFRDFFFLFVSESIKYHCRQLDESIIVLTL